LPGAGNGERSIPQVEALLNEQGLEYELVRTERPWHAAELAREGAARGFGAVVAVGGDGTANEVLNGLMAAKQAGLGTCALGMLCVGRGNDFAFSVGVPAGLAEGCRALAADHRRTIDVGWAVGGLYPQGRFFGNGVGIGFDAVVGFEAAKLRLTGFPAYAVAAFKTIFLFYKAPLVQVNYDGGTIQQPSLLVSVMNGRRLGGGFFMAPEGRPDDGLFDLCLTRQVSRARIFGLILHFMRGTQGTQASVRFERAQRVTVTALEGALPAHADGETLCVEGTRLELECLPQQIEVICALQGAP
jgi:diacylglycerol kinase (ATP)